MPFVNIMQDILVNYQMYDRLNTFYQKFNIDHDNRVFRFANKSDHTNNKVLVNLPDYYDSIE